MNKKNKYVIKIYSKILFNFFFSNFKKVFSFKNWREHSLIKLGAHPVHPLVSGQRRRLGALRRRAGQGGLV